MPIILTDLARSIGVTLGKISRQVTGGEPRRRRSPSGPSSFGATEDQVNMSATLPERINDRGAKVEDLAGTGVQDSLGG